MTPSNLHCTLEARTEGAKNSAVVDENLTGPQPDFAWYGKMKAAVVANLEDV